MNYSRLNHPGLYRSRSGLVFGVFTGLAEYLDFSVFWTRVVGLALVISFLPFSLLIYLLAAMLMKRR